MKLGLRRLAAVAGVLMMLGVSPGASAQPDDDDTSPPAAADSTTFALSDIGASDTIWFDTRRGISTSTFSFVVPRGLVPTTLNATIEIPIGLRYGSMAVTQGIRTIARLPLPPEDRPQMVIPLAGMEISGDWASLTVTVNALPLETYCWDPQAPIRLVNSSITFTGTAAAPTTVAAFLPPTLRRVTIALPPKPSQAESAATVQLAAAMTTRYGWQNTDIVVVALPEGATTLPAPAPPQERQIVVKEGPDKGLSLQGVGGIPSLLISGPGDELTNQTRLLTDDSLPFALSQKAVAGELKTERKPVRGTTTLEKLNQTGLTSESLRPEVTINIDQSRFAQPLNDIRVHLLGSYTPLSENLNGEVTVAAGDTIVDRWPVNPEGTIDRWVNIPNPLVRRSTQVKVRVQTTGDPGHCNDFLNVALRIDNDTEVQANRASPPVPPGFWSLPQSLMPRVQIGIGDDIFADTVRAAQIIIGLQRNSSLPLVTKVTSLQEAISSRDPAILIAADDWTDPTLTLPFNADLGNITIQAFSEGGDPVTLNLEPAITFGSLQTWFDGQRSILVATSNGSPAQLDELLRWLSEKRNRWTDLDGRAIISVPGSDPAIVPNRRSDLPEPGEASSDEGGADWVWWGAGVIAALSLVGALWILRKTIKQPKAGADQDDAAQNSADQDTADQDTADQNTADQDGAGTDGEGSPEVDPKADADTSATISAETPSDTDTGAAHTGTDPGMDPETDTGASGPEQR